jgi:hypothetical protein
LAFDSTRAQTATFLKTSSDAMMLDTLAIALRYRAAGFTDAQVEALVERDRMVEAVRTACDRPRFSPLAEHWRLWLTVGTIGIVGFCDTILFLTLKHWGGY